ncbi:MAG: DUF4124 domain-containing protein [Pseudomonadota bacterium]
MNKQLTVLLVGALLSVTTQAQTQIHKCVDAEGNIEYTDSPCPEPKPVEAEPAKSKDKPEQPVPSEFVWERKPVRFARSVDEIESCKDEYRDQIDAIEAEIIAGYSPDDGPEYKARLLKLTSAMRDCEYG